jgi:hypothetical protein
MLRKWRCCLQYRLSRLALLMLLLDTFALGMAQATGRYALSVSETIDLYVFGWPFTYSVAVDRYLPEDRSRFTHLPTWSVHQRSYWSFTCLCVDLTVSAILLAGTVWAAEVRWRQGSLLRFDLRQLLWWMSVVGAVLSFSASERRLVEWAAAQLAQEPTGGPVWASLSLHVQLPVLFSLGCLLGALGQRHRHDG